MDGRLLIVPVYHSKVTFAGVVRDAFDRFKPDVVAVELPPDIRENVLDAVQRLPFLSVVGYVEEDDVPTGHIVPDGTTGDGQPAFTVQLHPRYTYVPVHPGDGMIEAIRLATERRVHVEFIDTIIDGYVPDVMEMPDEEAIHHLAGFDEFKELVTARMDGSRSNPVDRDREACMATRVLDLIAGGKTVLCVIGFVHHARLRDLIERGARVAVQAARGHDEQQVFDVDPASADLILGDMPFVEYLHELARMLARTRDHATLIEGIAGMKVTFFERTEQRERGEATSGQDDGGAAGPGGAGKPAVEDARWLDAMRRTTSMEVRALSGKPFTRQLAIEMLFATASTVYVEYFARKPVPPSALAGLAQHLRNWAALRGKLIPSLDQVALAAKGFVNDEFAGIVLDMARCYPFVDPAPPYPTVHHDAGDVLKGAGNILLRNRFPSQRRSWMRLPIKRRPKERYPGEWGDKWRSTRGMCSYPPEDTKEETFFNQLRQRAMHQLEERHVKIHEFTSSLLDGVDFRETMRRWSEKKVFVKEIVPVIGKAGSVVVIFDEDERDAFTNKVTWWAEHGQESDMAFYATFPEDHLVGPGIARIEIGGMVSIFPPRHVPEIWTMFRAQEATFKKHEILALAGITFSAERFIPYIADNPPSKRLERIAAARGRVLVHVPLWKLSTETVESTRYLHVLAGKGVRRYAGEYIFL